jgi:hypothetical protein
MHERVRRRLVALLFLWPLTLWSLSALASQVDVPELGVRLTSLPDNASQPVVTSQASGYEATTRLGRAVFTIYRENDPAPQGSDVAEPAYRAILDAKYADSVKSKTQGAPTAVGGHSAWTVVDAREEGSLSAYTCVTYVLVDQHLYRLLVSAAPAAARPPEFDALVKAMSGIQFEQVHRATAG